jgi:hypothetical protein
MKVSLTDQAERARGFVIEGAFPLCNVALRIHDGRACCPCCGDSYVVSTNRLEVKQCPDHTRDCDHWQDVWSRRPRA